MRRGKIFGFYPFFIPIIPISIPLFHRTGILSPLSFSSLSIHPALVQNLNQLGYTSMTEIQAKSLPPIIKNKDVIAQAKTGSGKTAAFGIGLLNKLDVKAFRIQTLILCPTRELADQVAKEIRKLARTIHNIKVLTLCGGMPFGPQIGSLEHGAHIIVGTPGRIEEHVRKGTIVLDRVTTLVLDEADRMLEMGFQDALDTIIKQTPTQRQTLLFSATFPDQIQIIAQRYLTDPIMVKAESSHAESTIEQRFYKIPNNLDRTTALRILLMDSQPESAIVFCNTKRETQEVAGALKSHDFSVLALHGDLEQKDRDQTLVRFSNHSISVLVATDVAARGIDIATLDLVVNYHLSRDLEVHVHRIGRTGRAGNMGLACTFYTDKEQYKLDKLKAYLDQSIDNTELPSSDVLDQPVYYPAMVTLQIDGGKKQKVRPGDILGALTGENGVSGDQVGKIQIFENTSYVAINQSAHKSALKKISEGKLKGRSFRVRLLRG
jgi:ATP-independent RNA helicase DbpA